MIPPGEQLMVPPAPAPDVSPEIYPFAAKVMIVDDEPINVKVLQKYLRDAGFRDFVTTSDPLRAAVMVREERPDVILLDYVMPDVDGLQILREIRTVLEVKHVPVVILTASSDPNIRLSALELGATDFLTKPVDATELLARVRNAVISKGRHDRLVAYSQRLENEVRRRTVELLASRREVVQCLARAAEFRGGETGSHAIRVGRYASIIAGGMGFSEKDAEDLELAAQLHDVGKIGLPDAVLAAAEHDLDAPEALRRHCAIGKSIIRPGSGPGSAGGSPILEMAARIALTHHECWDGSGYPLGLAGEDIPLEGRITAVADALDVMGRQPRDAGSPRGQCFTRLEEGRGTRFDPQVLDAFFARSAEIVDVQIHFADDGLDRRCG